MMGRRGWYASWLAFALAACGGQVPPPADAAFDGSSDAVDGSASDAPDVAIGDASDAVSDSARPPLRIEWFDCALRTPTGGTAQCADVEVPLRRTGGDGRTIVLRVKRLVANPGPSRGQLWFLSGGPGGWTQGFDAFAQYLSMTGMDLDMYMMDQRGTGESTRLSCDDAEDPMSPGGVFVFPEEWRGCHDALRMQYGAGLAGFSVTETARDFVEMIAATRGPTSEIYLGGVSYGTYLANRILQLLPTAPAGVVLDSVSAPPLADFSRFDERMNQASIDYFRACGSDPFCSARLGTDPWARANAIVASLSTGHCPEAAAAGLDRQTIRRLFAQLSYAWETRVLTLALLRRLERCNAADIGVLRYLGSALASSVPTNLLADTPALGSHIALSELWPEPPPSLVDLQRIADGAVVSLDVGPRQRPLLDYWTRAPRDEWFGRWATTSAPMLILQGTLDTATPVANGRSARDQYRGTFQTYVEVPGAPHAVIQESPVSTDPLTPTCGFQMMRAFLTNPRAAVDTSCTTRVLPLQFSTSRLGTAYLGTANIWGD